MSSQRLSNHFSACQLISLSKHRMAAEFPGRDAHGPYVIMQHGYEPGDPAQRRTEFFLGRSGAWIANYWFIRMPVPERRKEFLFSTKAEVMELMAELVGPVRVISTRPANVDEDTPADEDFEKALRGNGA
jgi:hypothetical protein